MGAAITVMNNKIYIGGGYGINYYTYGVSTLCEYDPSNKSCSLIGDYKHAGWIKNSQLANDRRIVYYSYGIESTNYEQENTTMIFAINPQKK